LSNLSDKSRYGRIADLVNLEVLGSRRMTIIGQGAMGQRITEEMARHGVATLESGRLRLIDGDKVEARNLIGTGYRQTHLGTPKAQAAAEIVREINDSVNVTYWDRMLVKEDVPAVVDMASRSDLLGLFADDFELMLLIADRCSAICPEIMAVFGPQADLAEVAFSVPGGTPPLSRALGRIRRTAIKAPSALGCDTTFVASYVSGMCIRLLLGNAKGSDLFRCYANAPLHVLSLRRGLLEHQPPDVVRSIVCVQVQ
jgi:hypothetical protein